MDLTSFLSDIAWVRKLDSEPDIYAINGAIYVDFYSTVDAVAKAAPDLVCIDLNIQDGDWIAWEDAPQDDLDRYADEMQRFRWIVTAG